MDEGDIQNVQGWGYSRTGLRTTALEDIYGPAKLTVVPSRRGCSSDRVCSGGHKCCRFDCGGPPKPGECPPQSLTRGSCTRSFVPTERIKFYLCFVLCCKLAWHTVYMHKLKLTICVNAVKPGQCPKPKSIPRCAERCFHDGRCPATEMLPNHQWQSMQ
uniref:WAP domain-containing protein n=1 Tax=Sinocyclocheilus grahami TaxID=75366 RepID=A0A672NKZ1_SINGR